jgi:hypothetical protein
MSAVELHNSLYALGGSQVFRYLDTVQKLSLDSLTWQLMQLKLPQTAYDFPCFKKDTEVYLVIKRTLYSFTQANQDSSCRHWVFLELLQQRHSLLRAL